MKTHSTYLQESLKDNKILRWPNSLMPLKVYVSPFKWYQKSKQQDSLLYSHFVSEALNIWSKATNGAFTYTLTNDFNNSNINVIWRRVDRQSLGLCRIDGIKDNMIFSAEVEIGISDGKLHAMYQDTDEVKHTIIHEMGHAIGLPHSPFQEDIMYVPHQYGQIIPSTRDVNSVRWLYQLDPGFDPSAYYKDWGLSHNATIDDLIWVYENKDAIEEGEIEAEPQQPKPQPPTKNLDIHQQQDLLAYQNLYNLSLQKIKVDIHNKKKN